MNTYVLTTTVIFFTLCIISTQCLPLGADPSSEQAHVRVRRFTCDVLSVEAKGVKLNHSACAVHCLFRKRSGGYCNKKRVCICR